MNYVGTLLGLGIGLMFVGILVGIRVLCGIFLVTYESTESAWL